MDTTRLNSEMEIPAETLTVLAEIGQEINASLNLDEVLASAAAHVKRLIEYEIFSVLLHDESSNTLYFRFAIGHRDEVVQHWRIPMGDGIIGAAASSGQPIYVADVSKDSRYLNAVEAVRSELAVPLVVRGRVIGVMDIESREARLFQSIATEYFDAGGKPDRDGGRKRPAVRKRAKTGRDASAVERDWTRG